MIDVISNGVMNVFITVQRQENYFSFVLSNNQGFFEFLWRHPCLFTLMQNEIRHPCVSVLCEKTRLIDSERPQDMLHSTEISDC